MLERMVRTSLIVAAGAALVLGAGAARADVSSVKAGPRGDARALVDTALADVERALAVCWRGTPPARVRVALTVAASGTIDARPVGKGGAAQCAAGILAVWTLPGGAWTGELEIVPRAAEADLSATIQQQLLAGGADIRACQAQAPGAAGAATIRMRILSDGRISDVEVASKLGAALDTCVARAVGKLRVEPIGRAAPLRYQLAVAFAGGGSGGGKGGPAAPAEDPTGGAVGGALDGNAIKHVLGSVRARSAKCGDQGKTRGTVTVRWTIRPDGTTKNIVVKTPIGDAAIERCLTDLVAGLTFPKAAAETKVSFPFGFR